jgi:hypothetical protein
VIGASRGTSLFRASPATRTAIGESAVRPQASRTTVRRHHLHYTGDQQRPARQQRHEHPHRRRCTATFLVGIPEPSRRGHVAARLPEASNLGGETSMPAAESGARGCSGATSGKFRLAPVFGARTSWSTIRPRPEPASSSAAGTRGRGCGRGIDSQESSRTQPRCSEYHRSTATSGKHRRQS